MKNAFNKILTQSSYDGLFGCFPQVLKRLGKKCEFFLLIAYFWASSIFVFEFHKVYVSFGIMEMYMYL